jgi:hypothetical protein
MILSYVVNRSINFIFFTGLWNHSQVVAGDITTQPKQSRQAGQISNLSLSFVYQKDSTETTKQAKVFYVTSAAI